MHIYSVKFAFFSVLRMLEIRALMRITGGTMTLDEITLLSREGGWQAAHVEFDPLSLEWVVDLADQQGQRVALTDAKGARVGFADERLAEAALADYLDCPILLSHQQRRYD